MKRTADHCKYPQSLQTQLSLDSGQHTKPLQALPVVKCLPTTLASARASSLGEVRSEPVIPKLQPTAAGTLPSSKVSHRASSAIVAPSTDRNAHEIHDQTSRFLGRNRGS